MTESTSTLTPLPTPDAGDLIHLQSYDGSVRVRALVEREIFRRTVAALLAQGYRLMLNDGEDDVTDIITDPAKLLAAAMSTDEDLLLVYEAGSQGEATGFGYVRFIYGNTGWDVISDWTVNLDEVLQPVNDYAEAMSEWF